MEAVERVQKVRTALGMSRREFGDALGVTADVINNIERNRLKQPGQKEPLFRLICEKFSVNYEWLMTGDGEMFEQLPREEALAAEVTRVLYKESDTFRAKLISLLMRLDTEDWEALERIAKKMAEKKD